MANKDENQKITKAEYMLLVLHHNFVGVSQLARKCSNCCSGAQLSSENDCVNAKCE